MTLSDANVDKPSFVADTLMIGDSDVTHIFTLTVTDNNGETATATVTITVTSGFAAPVAEAGPAQTGVASGTVVTLDGRGSTVDRRRTPLSYACTRPSGTEGGTGGSVTLTGADTAQPTFMAETLTSGAEDVTYIFQLIVTDDDGAGEASEPDMVTITVTAPDLPPLVAEAGEPQTVASGTQVTLRGSGTETDSSRTVTYAWTRTGGTGDDTVMLSNPAALQPTFTAETLEAGAVDATHIFTLRVTDNLGSTAATDTVTITVISGFADPIAVRPGAMTLTGGLGLVEHRRRLYHVGVGRARAGRDRVFI